MILDGKNIKNIILDELKDEVSKLSCRPKLVVIQVGDDGASNVYIKQKDNMCSYVEYDFEHIKLDNNVDTFSMVEIIKKLNNDDRVNGILVQLPLPDGIDVNTVVNAIHPLKDVDGLSELNSGKLYYGKDALYSCTPFGIMEMLDRYNISVSGKNVVVIGRSNLVGKAITLMMLNRDATVSVCHSKTKNLSEYTRIADILVVAVGRPNFITADMVSEGTVVVDVGINRLESGLCGDVDFESVKDKCSYITPVPGGVGPMTVAILAKNILKAYKMQNNKYDK